MEKYAMHNVFFYKINMEKYAMHNVFFNKNRLLDFKSN